MHKISPLLFAGVLTATIYSFTTIFRDNQRGPSAVADEVQIPLGSNTLIDVLENDVELSRPIDPTSIRLANLPDSAVVTVDPLSGVVRIRHGGTDTDNSSFNYIVADIDGNYSEPAMVRIKVRELRATVKIISPKDGSIIHNSTVEVIYKVSGQDYDHLHLSIDQAGHNTIRDLTGAYIFENLTPGKHKVTAQLATSNHKPVPLKSATHSINILIEERQPGITEIRRK